MAYNLSKYTYMLKLCRTADREGAGALSILCIYIYICVNELYMLHIIMYYYYYYLIYDAILY